MELSPETVKFASSPYINGLVSFKQFGKSFISYYRRGTDAGSTLDKHHS